MSRLEKLRELGYFILSLAVPFVIVSMPSWLRSSGMNIAEVTWLSYVFPIAVVVSVGCIYILWRTRKLGASKDSEWDEKIDTLIKSVNKLIKEIRAERKAKK
jgi:hypothetical protein